jgi:ATP-binding cassette subfamily B (MDR/TAP) protein 1
VGALWLQAGNYLHYMARFFAGFAVGFSSVWQLTLVTLAVVPLIALAGGAYAVVMIGITSKSQKAYSNAGEIAEEAIAQIRTVYSFVGESKAVRAYKHALETTLKLGKRAGLAKGLGVGCTYGLLFGAWALLLWYASTLVLSKVTNGGQAFTTILNVIISGIALGQAAPNLTTFGKGKAAGYNILEMISRKPLVDRNTDGAILCQVRGQIQLQNVWFSYPSRKDIPVFQNFCLTIPAGKMAAIVGGSGSGKSTVVSLIERFYDPCSGEVLLDGFNIKNLELQWLREQIGLVNQEPALFATSILENILYGKDCATMEEIQEAAKAANAHAFIAGLPDGYDTQVGERGVQLSGGQKQRVAIARAMLRNPSILLLDEATSALDSGSEQIVQEALNKVMVGRTTVIIAHRLSTIQNAHMIAVVQHGVVVETGTHEELIVKGETGVYFQLVKLQEAAGLNKLMEVKMDDADCAKITAGSHSSRGGSMSHRWSQRLSFKLSESLRRVGSFRSIGHDPEADSCLGVEYEASSELASMAYPAAPSMWRLLKLNSPEWPYALLGSLGAIMAGCETPLFALAISHMLVTFYNPNASFVHHEVARICFIFAAATVVTVGIYVLQHFFFGLTGERLTMRVRELMFQSILQQEVGWFDDEANNSSLLATRLATDATMVRAAVGDRMSTILQNLALVITAFCIAFYLQWRVAAVILGTFPLLISAAVGEQLFLKGFGGDLSKAYGRASMVAGEAVGNIRTVAAFCAEEKVLDLFMRELEEPNKQMVMRGQLSGFGYGLSQFCMYSSYGLALWYASTLVREGKAQFGDVLKTFMVLIITAFGVAETLALAPDIVKGSKALSSIFVILDRQTAINPDNPVAEEVTSASGDIELRHVDFAYPARPDVQLFTDFSLKVKGGRSLALVGASGSGKSSVIALIARFYDPLAGKVMINGKDIRNMKLKSLRRHIGLVSQEPSLFACTIYENIVYGRDGATQSEVIEAAKAANAHSFISGLPNGYQTEVGERGVQLSGGQKQRVAIARAVLKDPAILLLDEATSALDAQSEKVVQEALDRLMLGRTTVVVAHRLSTIRNTHSIAVIHDGQIVEQGSHQTLMSKVGGTYAQLISLQQHTSKKATSTPTSLS